MAGKIYILFACDEWKSADSMRMVCATTDTMRLVEVIERELENGDMSFFWGNSLEDASVDAFKKFVANGPGWEFMNGPLEYGYLEIVEDGEVL